MVVVVVGVCGERCFGCCEGRLEFVKVTKIRQFIVVFVLPKLF